MVKINFIFFISFLIIQSISWSPFNLKMITRKIYEKKDLRVGTTGDYKPVSFLNKETNTYEGIDIELSKLYAKERNYNLQFIPTTWPTLLEDTINKKFDFAICGITITEKRLNELSCSMILLRSISLFLTSTPPAS